MIIFNQEKVIKKKSIRVRDHIQNFLLNSDLAPRLKLTCGGRQEATVIVIEKNPIEIDFFTPNSGDSRFFQKHSRCSLLYAMIRPNSDPGV